MNDRSTELAYFYPEPYWVAREADSLKTLLLFFDGIAILLPSYMRNRNLLADPVLAGPLYDSSLLHILEPEHFIDQQMAESLTSVMVELITQGAFDELDRERPYHALSRSRTGWNVDIELSEMLLEELRTRGLAQQSEDNVSVPLHPVVRKTILVLLAQLARDAGKRGGMNLHPVTPDNGVVEDLLETLSMDQMPSSSNIVTFDLEVVSPNLAPVPVDEVLDFKKQYGSDYRAYARNVREFVAELAQLSEEERRQRLLDRREELRDSAARLRRAAQGAWPRRLASFALGAAGAAWSSSQGDPVTGALSLATGTIGAMANSGVSGGAYSYLFEAQQLLGGRAGVA